MRVINNKSKVDIIWILNINSRDVDVNKTEKDK